MQEFGQELAEVQAAAAAAACDMLDSPLKTQREDEDATRWVEDHPYVDVKHVNPWDGWHSTQKDNIPGFTWHRFF